jgi:mRNA-degrading endonuclease toxin of MazEF toxin-antitoxin module
MPMKTSRRAQLLAASAVAALAGCDLSAPSISHEKDSRPQAVVQAQDVKQRQVAFLNRIREADPQARTIDRALINEHNELGLVLDRTVEMDKIPALMRTMLTKMAQEFPGEDLTVLAYTPSNPPRKIGTARLNAQTRDMTYTPEK